MAWQSLSQSARAEVLLLQYWQQWDPCAVRVRVGPPPVLHFVQLVLVKLQLYLTFSVLYLILFTHPTSLESLGPKPSCISYLVVVPFPFQHA